MEQRKNIKTYYYLWYCVCVCVCVFIIIIHNDIIAYPLFYCLWSAVTHSTERNDRPTHHGAWAPGTRWTRFVEILTDGPLVAVPSSDGVPVAYHPGKRTRNIA